MAECTDAGVCSRWVTCYTRTTRLLQASLLRRSLRGAWAGLIVYPRSSRFRFSPCLPGINSDDPSQCYCCTDSIHFTPITLAVACGIQTHAPTTLLVLLISHYKFPYNLLSLFINHSLLLFSLPTARLPLVITPVSPSPHVFGVHRLICHREQDNITPKITETVPFALRHPHHRLLPYCQHLLQISHFKRLPQVQ